MADLGQQVDAAQGLFGTEVTGGHIWHLSLTNHAGGQGAVRRGVGQASCAAVVDRLGFSSAGGQGPLPMGGGEATGAP